MASIEEEAVRRLTLDEALEGLSQVTAGELVKTEQLGRSLDFSDGVPFFERTLNLFREVAASDLEFASFTALKNLAAQSTAALAQFEAIRAFSVEANPANPKETRDNLINQVRDSYDGFYNVVTPHISYAARKGSDLEKLGAQARTEVDELVAIRQAMNLEINKQRVEVDEILDSMRQAAGEAGVAQHALAFQQEAEAQDEASIKWLRWTVALALITATGAGLAIWFWFENASNLTTTQGLQIGVAKLALFAVLYYATVWCSRTYNAHKHNYTVNKHRQNALTTFREFVAAAVEDSTKDAVLLQATRSVFAHQPTGFERSGESETHSSQMLEVFTRNQSSAE